MAGGVFEIAFSLTLLVSYTPSIIQGVKNAELLFNDTVEAEVGQNITISCFKDFIDYGIVDVKWTKNGGTKLAVYNLVHKEYRFWPNVTIQAKENDEKHLISADLYLSRVSKWDSGTYSCEVAKFPLGYFTSETKLTVKDEIKVLCNVNKVVEVHFGDNAAIQCTVNSDANYTWTKDNKLVSENESLVLWKVTEDHAGVYKLTVNAGYKTLHKDFVIHVLATTTILRTDLTESTQGPSDSPHTSTATPLTTVLPIDIHWTTEPNSSTVIVTAAGNVTPSTTLTSLIVPSSPETQTDHLLNSSMSNHDVTVLTSTQRMASIEMKNESSFHIQSTKDISSVSTEETRTAENILSAGHTGGPSTGQTSVVIEKETKRSHMLLVFIIVLLLLLIVVVVILYSKQLIKKRMDLPPPFKPPPPPVKYTAARRNETQLFPSSRCNSISAPLGPISI